MRRNRCVHLFDEQGKPIGHARLRSDASPQTIAAIEELARICVAGLKLDAELADPDSFERAKARFAARMRAREARP
jgi:hypothetical protein